MDIEDTMRIRIDEPGTDPTSALISTYAAAARPERVSLVTDLVHRVAGRGHPLSPNDDTPDVVLDRTLAWGLRRMRQTPAAMSDRFVTPHQLTRAAAS